MLLPFAVLAGLVAACNISATSDGSGDHTAKRSRPDGGFGSGGSGGSGGPGQDAGLPGCGDGCGSGYTCVCTLNEDEGRVDCGCEVGSGVQD